MEVAKVKQDIVTRRGQGAREIAKVAAGRKMLEVVFYVPRDGQARCLTRCARPYGGVSSESSCRSGSGMTATVRSSK